MAPPKLTRHRIVILAAVIGVGLVVERVVAFGGAEGIEEVGLPDAPASQGGFPGGLEEYGVPVQPDFSKMFGG